MKLLFTFFTLSLFLIACQPPEAIIPDANFKNALLNGNCIDTDGDEDGDRNADLNNDGKIQLSEIENLEFLKVSDQKIKSLEGIEQFKNLKFLSCYDNELTSLDVSKNKNLEVLYCFDNKLTNLDVSENAQLKTLGCRGNSITELDLSANKLLENLYCYKNKLQKLNLKNGNNKILTSLSAKDNPALRCIQVDNASATFAPCDDSGYGGWCVDSLVIYSLNCQ
jgi:Leucine-rich repeat (LRR) protein